MLRPRDALAGRIARDEIDRSFGQGLDDPERGFGRTIALVDGLPDLATEELIGANLSVRVWGGATTPDSHTTFAASVLVGRQHGLAPRARLLVAAVTADDGSIAPCDVAAAIEWAVEAGAQIVVIPLGDHRSHADVSAAVDFAIARGVVIVAAAGNAHPHPLLFPARLPGVIAVGACDERGELLDDCCRAPRLDLVMPALRILAATAPGREAERSGTSVAAALAGGLLTLDSPANPKQPTNRKPQ